MPSRDLALSILEIHLKLELPPVFYDEDSEGQMTPEEIDLNYSFQQMNTCMGNLEDIYAIAKKREQLWRYFREHDDIKRWISTDYISTVACYPTSDLDKQIIAKLELRGYGFQLDRHEKISII